MSLLGYTRDKQTIKNIILDLASKKRQVVYGGQSAYVQLPTHLRRETSDFDILTKKAKQSAEELKEKLNKEYNEDKFKVEPAKHQGTFKVKDSEGNTIADYTQTTKKPNSINSLGVKYAKLNYSEGKLRKILKNPENKHRFEKDRDMLNRIKQTRTWD